MIGRNEERDRKSIGRVKFPDYVARRMVVLEKSKKSRMIVTLWLEHIVG